MIDVLKSLLLPPLNLLLLLLAGLALRRWRARTAAALLAGAIAGLYLLSTAVVANLLVSGLETDPALSLESLPDGPQAIVVLAAGRDDDAPDFAGGDTVGPLTLVRLRYAAMLHRQSGLPILVAGGGTPEEQPTLADLMARSLSEDFGIPVRWRETGSLNTAENAFNSAAILREAGISRVFLVTHAWHMRRAVWIFRVAGLDPVPAPTAFISDSEPVFPGQPGDYIARSSGLLASTFALHEWLGLIWYRIRYG
ncbi:MAG: YdcF family protein [Alphaproteobacteria bacterium]|jgi:uncharacterized SAM-binding protein YcdF (DUF218 family)|nr:YdcF family protein [Alphaproteobacteria bacterium]